ncbi:hypothetical protein AMTRI_Chr04g189140 [Amborella trichopoda]
MAKKRKSEKKSEKKSKKQKETQSKPAKKEEEQKPISSSSDSDSSDSEAETSSPEKFSQLIEPFAKEQIIEFICDIADKDPSVYTHLKKLADKQVSHRKVFVHGLGWDSTSQTLISTFEKFGEVEDCNVVLDKVTGRAKGYGFVLFKKRKGAIKALKQPQKKVQNRLISCQLASLGPVPSHYGSDVSARKIYVSNVPSDASAEKLKAFFSKFGEIEDGPIGFDKFTGKSRGFALFVYKTLESAKKAIEDSYRLFDGHVLHVQKAADGPKFKPMGQAAQAGTPGPMGQTVGLAPGDLASMVSPGVMAGGFQFGQGSGIGGFSGVVPSFGQMGTSGFGVGGLSGVPMGYDSVGLGGYGLGGVGTSVLGTYGGQAGLAGQALGLQGVQSQQGLQVKGQIGAGAMGGLPPSYMSR